jgi:uncharacterized cupredoxin-like copper-binding protein
MYSKSVRRICATLSIIALSISACATSQASPSPSSVGPGATTAAGATTVQVTLQEWSVVPAPTSAAAGVVTFRVTNNGPDDVHEFVIVKTDVDFGALPTDETGAVSESGEGLEVVDEIEDIRVGETQEVTATLASGKYVLLCNVYDETENEAHYKMGMRIPFELTG